MWLLTEARGRGVDLSKFIDDFYYSNAANIVPLAQYGRLLRLLLQQGVKVLVNLLTLLLTRNRDNVLEKLCYYSNPRAFREQARHLSWETFF